MQQNPKYSKQKEKSFTSKEIHKNAVSLKMKYLIRNKIYLHTYELYIFMVAYSSYFLLSYLFNHFCFCIMNNPQRFIYIYICIFFSFLIDDTHKMLGIGFHLPQKLLQHLEAPNSEVSGVMVWSPQ